MNKRWKRYLTCMLASMLILSGSTGVFAALPDETAGVQGEAVPEGAQTGPVQDDAAEQNGLPDGSVQSGEGNGDGGSGTDAGLNGDSADNAGSDPVQGKEGKGDGSAGISDGSAADGEGNGDGAQQSGADTDETGDAADRTVRADIEKNDTNVSADISVDDEDDDNVVIRENDKPYLALGANLREDQKKNVLNLMGINPANLDQYNVVTVTNDEEHQYLDGYLDAATIGTRALSSVVIVKRDKGEGIHISTKNITYCTVGMYKNALATAGLEDADVIVAGPFPLSGTAALIGAMKAYADMENTNVDPESLDAAMNEIVVTGELNDSLGDDVQTEEFIAYVKQKVVEGSLQDKGKIQEVIADACKKFQITLSDKEKEQITALMEKIGSLDIDVDSLLKQAGSIYESLKEMDASTGILGSIAAFFKNLLEAVIEFFKGLFS